MSRTASTSAAPTVSARLPLAGETLRAAASGCDGDGSARAASEYADRLGRRTTPAEVLQWWDPRPATWIDESIALRDRLYPATGPEAGLGTPESPVKLSWNYEWQWRPSVELRLQQAGVRLAAYLDWVFGGEAN